LPSTSSHNSSSLDPRLWTVDVPSVSQNEFLDTPALERTPNEDIPLMGQNSAESEFLSDCSSESPTQRSCFEHNAVFLSLMTESDIAGNDVMSVEHNHQIIKSETYCTSWRHH